MNPLSERLKTLYSQINLLNSHLEKLLDENESLKDENKKYREKLELKGNRIKALKQEKELIINAKSLKDVGLSSKEARYKINELVRGIDKCIAQLNQ
jgi:regulator of replication initiation timing